MRNYILTLLIVCFTGSMTAQELNCTVIVNAEQTGQTQISIFKTLEKSLQEFINQTTWTNKVYAPHERIDCSMMITVSEYESDRFSATLQVQSSRPIYQTTYSSPIVNYNDEDFNFQYLEFENLTYNPNANIDSNLIAVISYYVYIILGADADTYKRNSGTEYYEEARKIVNNSQALGARGWKSTDGLQNRFHLTDQILSPTYKEYRNVMYAYHRNGLDQMSGNTKVSKQRIANILKQFNTMHTRRPNSFLQRTFFDAKSDEIVDIFSDGPSVPITDIVSILKRVSPTNTSKWSKIKF
ncbi:MAG: DUF4835 family protein [Flavobacteriaceae bacterium]|nr:DUF4835 family protein [Flavobacteriaceae bacterium]